MLAKRILKDHKQKRKENNMTINVERPCLNFEEEVTGRQIQMAFGYMTDEYIPTMAVFVEGIDDPILFPKDMLQIALFQGWELEVGGEDE